MKQREKLSDYTRALLGLEGVALPAAAEAALHERFESLPYARRFDGDVVLERFELISQAIKAMSRAEVFDLIAKSADLGRQVSELLGLVVRLDPQ